MSKSIRISDEAYEVLARKGRLERRTMRAVVDRWAEVPIGDGSGAGRDTGDGAKERTDEPDGE